MKPVFKATRKFQLHCKLNVNADRSFDRGICIVVPCFNHASYLIETFKSIANQTYRPFEVVFVEDCSTDNTLLELARLVDLLPTDIRWKIIRTSHNSGQSMAINLGVESSEASIFIILNDDDYLMHDALEVSLRVLKKNSDIYLFGASFIPLTSDMDITELSENRKRMCSIEPNMKAWNLIKYGPENARQFKYPNEICMAHTGTTFFRSAWKAVGGYYNDKSKRLVPLSDRDFQMRVCCLFPIAVSNTVPITYWRMYSSVDKEIYS